MSKQANQPRTAANEARAYAKYIRVSPQKLGLVVALIRGKSAEKALVDLEFSKRRIAKDVRKVLASAVANAENNQSLDVDRLVVAEAYVGKTMSMKRFHARGRGRASSIEKPFSNLTIIVREETDEDKARRAAKKDKKAASKAKADEKAAAAGATVTKAKPAAKKAAKAETKKD